MGIANVYMFFVSEKNMRRNEELEYIVEDHPPVSFIEVEPDVHGLPNVFKDRVSVDVIHDGAYIPPQFLSDNQNNPFDPALIQKHYTVERDWGANFVAERLCQRLGLSGFLTVNTARCLMDFGRFPGSTKEGATHLGRQAINAPFSNCLDFAQKRSVLEDHYDVISDTFDEYLQGKVLKIAVHTYDKHNASGTVRPHVSLVTRMLNYQIESRMPTDIFDPLYPDVLADYTVDRVLIGRMSLTLEKSKIAVGNNYPYLLPEGSIEVRHQVWRFFDWLHRRFTYHNPETAEDPAFNAIWRMLKDTNFRSAESAALRSMVHLYRRAHKEHIDFYDQTILAYHKIHKFIHVEYPELIEEYRLDPMRCMSLGIEVRKDLIWEFDSKGNPIRPNLDRAYEIADKMADSMIEYFTIDRVEMNRLPSNFTDM